MKGGSRRFCLGELWSVAVLHDQHMTLSLAAAAASRMSSITHNVTGLLNSYNHANVYEPCLARSINNFCHFAKGRALGEPTDWIGGSRII